MSLTGKPSLTTAAPVTNDGFWPDLSLADLMTDYRIPAEYDDGVIEMGLVMAIARVNEVLAPVKGAIVLLGFSSLADYNTANVDLINGLPVLDTHYSHAVFCRAKAGLLKQFNSLNRKEAAENAAKESDTQEYYWLDQSQLSIKSLFTRFLPDVQTSSTANTSVTLI